jgi:uncharacterized protein
VRFNKRARLDTRQVDDRRGARGRGGSFPGGIGGIAGAGGAGLVGLLVLVFALLGGGGGGGGGFFGDLERQLSTGQGGAVSGEGGTPLSEQCRTGEDANRRQDCRIVAIVNSVQQYWAGAFEQAGRTYRLARTQLFQAQTRSACGAATSATGPFYCPADQTIYMDLGFFEQLARSPFDVRGGPFAEAYVVAHEYGHHVQTLLGQTDGGDRSGPESGSVRLELQADCYAGVWAGNAEADGIIEDISDQDIADGLEVAAAIGDDRIQEATQGRSNPESFTHGTAEQRQRWFTTGYRERTPAACDTFTGGI